MSANIISEFLLSLGFQDNASKDFEKTIKNAEKKAKNTVKNVALAGAAVGTIFATATTGVIKFMKKLSDGNKEIKEFARQNSISEAEAYKLKTTLDAMGKTLEEIQGDNQLSRMFQRLQEDAEKITPPDMSEGLAQVEAISEEFTRLRHAGAYAIQWIGHYLFKYLQQPLEKVKETFSTLNDNVIKGMPKWTDKVAQVLASVVKLGITVLRGASNIFKAVKKVFDMIPKEIKIVTAALAALALFIRAGPIKQLIVIFTIALLLLEDFYTFIDGGDSLLGAFWQRLIDIWNVLKDSGTIDRLWDIFISGLEYVSSKIIAFKDYIVDLYKTLKDNGTLEKIGKTLLSVGKAISGTLGKLNEMGLLGPILKGLLATFLGFKAIDGVTGKLNVFSKLLEGIADGSKKLGKLKGLKEAFSGLKKALTGLENAPGILGKLGKAFSGIFKIFSANPFMVWIIAIGALIGIFAALYKNSEGFRELINNIKEHIKNIVGKIKEMLPAILEMVPEMLEAAFELIQSLAEGFLEALPVVLDAVICIIEKIVDGIIEYLPIIIETGIQLINSLIQGIVKALPKIITAVINLIKAILRAITKNLPKIIKAGISILKALIEGIVSILPELISAAIDLILAIFEALIDNLPMIIEAGIEILLALIEGIVEVLPELIIAAIDLLLAIVDAIIENIDTIIEGGIKIVVALIEGLIKAIPRLIAAMPRIVSAIMEGLGKAKDAVFELGKDLISKLWDGIKSMGSWISDKVGGFVKGLFSKDKIEDAVGSSEAAQDETPGHADGGIFSKAHLAHVSEGNQPEAIIPLNKPKRAQEVLSGAMKYLGLDSPESIENKIKGFADFTQKASGMLGALGSGISQAPNEYATTNSTVNNNQYDMQSHFTIYDSSGRPDATAHAVDRTMQLRYRNLKGVLN